MKFMGKCRYCGEAPHVVYGKEIIETEAGTWYKDYCVLCNGCETETEAEKYNVWKEVIEIENEHGGSTLPPL